eukprot:2834195-Rhodomonas_salina.3
MLSDDHARRSVCQSQNKCEDPEIERNEFRKGFDFENVETTLVREFVQSRGTYPCEPFRMTTISSPSCTSIPAHHWLRHLA